jgi:glycosyltransferase involved in cell wall biosynthesis
MPIGNLGRDSANVIQNIKSFTKIKKCELILIVDSGKTYEITKLRNSNQGIKNLKILSGHFSNPGGPRNLGIRTASGSWLAFVDSDDKIDFAKFFHMIGKAQELGKELAVGNYSVERKGSVINGPNIHPGSNQWAVDIARNPGIWRMGFLRKSIAGVQFPEIKMGEDQVFLARVGFWKLDMYLSPELVYCYRSGNPGQLTMNKLAISDLVTAQEETLEVLLSNQKQYRDIEVLAIMLAKQFLTATRRLGFRGLVISIRTLLKSTEGFKSYKILFHLLQTCFLEISVKIGSVIFLKGKNE